ncbi:MAG TPA: zinc ribbon domain-containing protein [Tepidisphaeraceae bacterium]|jgi:hypothetical protein
MIRRLFTTAAVMSLLLCLATVALWVRSWSVADQVLGGFGTPKLNPRTGEVEVSPAMAWSHYAGRLLISHFPAMVAYKTKQWAYRNPAVHTLISEVDNRVFWHPRLAFAGFRFATVSDGEWDLLVPDYAPAVLFAVTPLLWLALALRRKRSRAEGRCTSCGYDLRASMDRCPECGRPIPPETRRAPA